jgi:hypothetical protein
MNKELFPIQLFIKLSSAILDRCQRHLWKLKKIRTNRKGGVLSSPCAFEWKRHKLLLARQTYIKDIWFGSKRKNSQIFKDDVWLPFFLQVIYFMPSPVLEERGLVESRKLSISLCSLLLYFARGLVVFASNWWYCTFLPQSKVPSTYNIVYRLFLLVRVGQIGGLFF